MMDDLQTHAPIFVIDLSRFALSIKQMLRNEGGKLKDGERFWRERLRHRAVAPLITLVVLVAAVIIFALTASQAHRAAAIAAETQAQASAHVVATHVQWMMEASDQALRRIEAAIGSQSIRREANTVGEIDKAVGQLPADFQYSVYDEQGQLRFSNYPHATVINVADREYFQQLKSGGDLSISPQLEERLSHLPVFIIARPIQYEGEFRGIASIAIPAAKMDEFWASMALGPNSTVSVTKDDGWLLARYPAVPQSLDMHATPLFVQYRSGRQQGVYHSSASPADGIARIVGFRKVASWPIVAVAGIEQGYAMRAFWSAMRLQLALSIPLTFLLLAGTYFVVRLLQAFERRNGQLEDALERNLFLFKEIHHRVKNNLQAVSSLIRLQPISADIKQDLDRKLAAMVAVHEQIYQNDQFDRVDVAPYAEKMVRDLALTYGVPVEIELKIDHLTVERDQALPLGMIINEVVSNAFKYAYCGREGGLLQVQIYRSVDGKLIMNVHDDGPGFDPSGRSGTGTKLIGAFVRQLDGQSSMVQDQGTTFHLEFPLSIGH